MPSGETRNEKWFYFWAQQVLNLWYLTVFFLTSTLKTLTISFCINSPEYWALLPPTLLGTSLPSLRIFPHTWSVFCQILEENPLKSLGFSLNEVLSLFGSLSWELLISYSPPDSQIFLLNSRSMPGSAWVPFLCQHLGILPRKGSILVSHKGPVLGISTKSLRVKYG